MEVICSLCLNEYTYVLKKVLISQDTLHVCSMQRTKGMQCYPPTTKRSIGQLAALIKEKLNDCLKFRC